MLGPSHVWGEELTLRDPSVYPYPDHVVKVLWEYGYTPETLIQTIGVCLGMGSTLKPSHDQYHFPWPDWLRRGEDRSRWGEGKGQEEYDGSRYWEFNLMPLPVPVPYTSPAPGQVGPTALDELFLSPEYFEAMDKQSQIISIGGITVLAAVLAPESLLVGIPATVSQLPPDFHNQVLRALGY
jgi:hypothetical protein